MHAFEPPGETRSKLARWRRSRGAGWGWPGLLVLAVALGDGASQMAAAQQAAAQQKESPLIAIVPQPQKITAKPGHFTLVKKTPLEAPAALRAVAERFRDDVRPGTGVDLPIVARGRGARISLRLDRGLKGVLGDEGYRLSVTPRQVTVVGAAPAGVFYGLQSLRQLLPPETFRKAAAPEASWSIPGVQIEDRPRFSWRGSHVDVGRHFQPKDFIFKHLDLMALHKLNVFHWHLTEDQGWRLEIKKYPKLTEVGAWRKDSALGPPPPRVEGKPRQWKFRGKPHGGFYTQEDAKEVVRYAAERFITVMPEIELPGHAKAAIAAYPHLGNTGKKLEVETTWGIFDEVYNVEDSTLAFLKDVLTEVLAIFPSKFIHIGGDEVKKDEWKASPKAQARMKAEGLKSEEELQSWFIKQIGGWLSKQGRRLVGWEEILEGGLAPGATVMAWQSIEPAIKAAKLGHDAIMAPTEWTYLDYYQSKDPREPVAIGGHNPLEKVYAFDPIPDKLPPELEKHILGGQAQIWTEYMPNSKHVEYMAWPRLCALAEAVWSNQEVRGFEDFKKRLATQHLERLKHLDVMYRPLEGPWPAAASVP